MNNNLDPYLTMLEYHTSVSWRISHCFFSTDQDHEQYTINLKSNLNLLETRGPMNIIVGLTLELTQLKRRVSATPAVRDD